MEKFLEFTRMSFGSQGSEMVGSAASSSTSSVPVRLSWEYSSVGRTRVGLLQPAQPDADRAQQPSTGSAGRQQGATVRSQAS